MLKKHNKLIMLLVLVTFMFTMVGSAGAASYSDVTGTSVEAAAIYRLSGLGVLDGYPDGTFGPEKTITRAEFAKIACVTAGLKSVASGMGGTASPFSDVATDYWANGWINVAAAQGFVKGDPAGTFRPEAQITQAEAVTVLMRLLGYNDNLAGEWPSDYIAKAANLGILDDVTFVANQAATRGIVAVLASATLDENIVDYEASNNLFKAVTPAKTLLADKFKDSAKFKNALAIQFRVDSDSKLYLEYYQYNEDQDTVLDATGKAATAVAANLQEKKLADNCVFSGGGSILTVIENFVEFDVNDDGDITNIVVKDYGPVGPKLSATSLLTEVKVDGGKAKANDKTYSFLAPTQVVKEGVLPTEFTITGSAFTDGTYNTADVYRLILNKNGKVAGLRSNTVPTPGIVDKVVGERIYYKTNATPVPLAGTNYVSQGNFADEDIFVARDSKPATLADIQPLDAVNVIKGYRGTDYYIIASSTKITGKLESAEYSGANVKKVKVMGMKWTVPYGANFGTYTTRYSIDNGDEVEGNLVATTLDSEYDMWNTDVQVLIGASGKVAALIFGEAASSSKMYGVITEITTQMAWTDGTTVRNVKLMKADGKEYSYPISDDTYIKVGAAASKKIKDLASLSTIDATILSVTNTTTGAIAAGGDDEKLVNVSLKSSGLVDRIEVINPADVTITPATDLDTDNYLVKIGTKWVDAKDVVVFNLNHKDDPTTVANEAAPAANISDLDDTKVAAWTEFKKATTYAAWYIDSNNKLQYVVVNAAALTTGDKYAIYQESYSSSDNWVTFVGKDPIQNSDSSITGLSKGDVVRYTMSGAEANIAARVVPYGTKSAIAVDKISGQTILLDNGTSYKTDSDTVYLDAQDKDKLQVLDGVSVGDGVVVFADGTGLAQAVVVVKYDKTAPTVTSAAFTNATTLKIIFSEPVIAVVGDFTAGAVTPKIAGGATGYTIAAIAGSGTQTITLTVAGTGGTGTLATGDTATVAIAATVTDLTGNAIAAIAAQAVAAF